MALSVYKKSCLALFILASIITSISSTLAQGETPIDFLLSDEEFYNGDAWTLGMTEQFLAALPGRLHERMFPDRDGTMRNAAEIIVNAARAHDINPKVIIATLQKEQSLIENPSPSQDNLDWAMGYGVCDSCTHDDLGIQKFRGFAIQIDEAAKRLAYIRTNANEFFYAPMRASPVDGVLVTPRNTATAALLNYTPHFAGNIRFLELWRKYFARQYTEGSLLRVRDERDVWYIQYRTRRKVSSPSVLLSRFDVRTIVPVERWEIEQYPLGRDVRFPEFALLRSKKNELYLLQGDTRRKIISMKLFRKFGFTEAELMDASDEDLTAYEEGMPLTTKDLYPLPTLMQNKKTGGVYLVQDGVKRPIVDRSLLSTLFPNQRMVKVAPALLDELPQGPLVRLKDSMLVRSPGDTAVYIIDQTLRRRFTSANAFIRLGYQWGNVKTVPDRVLALHDEGAPIEF